MMKPIVNIFRYILLIFALLVMPSCGNSGEGTSSNITDINNSQVEMSNISTIPSSGNKSEFALLPIKNNLAEGVTFRAVKLFKSNGTVVDGTNSEIDVSGCLNISAKSSCNIKIFTMQKNDNYLIKLSYADNQNNVYGLSQVINLNDSLPNQDGFIYDGSNLTIKLATNTLSLPIRLAQDYTSIKIFAAKHNANIYCPNNSYKKNTLCTILIDGSSSGSSNNFSDNSTMRSGSALVDIIGYYGVNGEQRTLTSVLVTNNQNANIVSSGINAVVSPNDGTSPKQIFLYNSGANSASQINITAATPIIISSNTCGTTLAANATCSFFVNVTGSIASGQSSVNISYYDSSETQSVNFNVIYISPTPSPGLTLTPSGVLTNIINNQGPVFYTINVVNSGNVPFTSIYFSDINKQASTMSSNVTGSTCINGQSLAVGSSCTMILSYAPTATGSGTVNFIPTATYSGQSGQDLNYTNSDLTISYSSIASATFTAVGDFGMVMTSPSGGSGTWVANIDSPFATTAISATGMIKNGTTYVISLSNGLIKYSTLNGIFWLPATTTRMNNNNTCGITLSNGFYYTCGAVNVAYATICTTTGRYCIIRSNNLTGAWSPMFQAVNANAMNGIYSFFDGTTNTIIVTTASTAANSGLIASNNGTIYTTVSSGQAVAGNNNFTPVSFNFSTSMVFAWTSTGVSSVQSPLSNSVSAWTPTTSTPGTTAVTSVAHDAATTARPYILTTTTGAGNGLIYSVTNPNNIGAVYTVVQTNVGQPLNYVIYNSLGPKNYIAVGNAGVTVTSNSQTGALGTWSTGTVTVGQATTPNLRSAYLESSNNTVWIMGVNALFNSSDATTWNTPSLQSITKNGSNYLAVDNQGFIYSSSNLTTWTQQTNPTTNIINHVYCASTNLCFAVGNSGTILKSTNGTTWSSMTSGTINNLQDIICRSGRCIIVGGSGSASSGTILTSSDYTNWTIQTSSLATTSLNSINYFNGQFIAVGNGGTIFTSTNSVNWLTNTSGTANNLNAIACGISSGGCVAVGNAGTILYSTYGTSWVAATSGTTNDITSAAYNGVFVSVGKGGYIRFSSTGTGTWTAATFPTTSSATNNLRAVISN